MSLASDTALPGPRPSFADRAARRRYAGAPKRALDLLVVAIVALPVLAALLPLMLLVALDGHSPFFGQARLGRDGRTFRMWKLRTMVPDAEAALAAALARDPALRREWDERQKLRHDPRVTPLGALLRRSSLDELPQLLNVLFGDMSLVGPRPMLPEQRAIYPGEEYFALRPGLTGPWQVSARNEANFAERARFDRDYFHALSFATDLRLIRRTVGAVLNGTGC